jgi:hypothetical protein
MKEQSRKEVGETSKGHVVVVQFEGSADIANNLPAPVRYEVRHGSHTVGAFASAQAANATAKAITGAD